MSDISALIKDARETLGELTRETLYEEVRPQLTDEDIDLLLAEAIWNRSLSISSAGRQAASRAAAQGNEDDDFEFAFSGSSKFGKGMGQKSKSSAKARRGRGQARAETASLVERICKRWLSQYQALGSTTGEKPLGEYTSSEFLSMASAKKALAGTYAAQASSDERIAIMMNTLGCETAAELPAESLYSIIKNYRGFETQTTTTETVEEVA